eukprot:7363926-Alexandrium_andersonii.AAC.1
MSASLVGSEMCIRDSPCSVQRPQGQKKLGCLLAATLRTAASTSEWLRACLLYTSDAADDM